MSAIASVQTCLRSHHLPRGLPGRRCGFWRQDQRGSRGWSTLLVFAVLALTSAASAVAEFSVLVFSKTTGFRHGSIQDGIDMVSDLADQHGWTDQATEATTLFTDAGLSGFDVVVWLSTTGDVLSAAEQAAFERFLQAGGGYVGIHAAADCEYDWPWYGELLGNGAWFQSHPPRQDAEVAVEDAGHPGAGSFNTGAPTEIYEEWYNFRANPRTAPGVTVVLTVDEDTYAPGSGAMGADHPIAWAHAFDGGRVFYTALGHESQTYQRADFRDQIAGAIRWAGGIVFRDGFESGGLDRWVAGSR